MSLDPRPAPPSPAKRRRRRPTDSWCRCTEPDQLARLHDPAFNLVLWPRRLPPQLAPALEAWARSAPPDFDRVLDAEPLDLSATLRGLRAEARQWLHDDICALRQRFSALVGEPRMRLMLAVIASNRCRRFHMDYLRQRLVTTYLGPGTEWLPERALCREALARPARPTDDPAAGNVDIIRDPAEICRANAGDVLVMKGARHPHANGAVHRSPPIEGTDQLRVVLILTTVEP